MEFRKQSFRDNSYRVIFDEHDWWAMDCFKQGKPYYLALRITVFKRHEDGKERQLAYYFREFDKEPNVAHVSKFIDKFLADKEYRQQYFVEGEPWEGKIIQKAGSGLPINPRCEKAIQSLNSMKEKKLNFQKVAALKTYGMDGFSRMKEGPLKELIGEDNTKMVDEELDKDAMRLSAYRWIARGLRPNLAIRKVKTDAEVANNAKGRR